MKHRGSPIIFACAFILASIVAPPSTRFANNDVSSPTQSLGIPKKDNFGQPIDVGLLILGHSTSAVGDYPAKLAQALNDDPNNGRNYVVFRIITNGDGGFLWTQLSFQPNDLQYDRVRASQSPQQWCQDNTGARWSCRRARLEEGLTGVKPPSCFSDTSCSPPETISLTWSEGGVTQTGELSFHEAWKKMDVRLALIQDTTNRSWPVDDFNNDGAVDEKDFWPESRIPGAARPCGGTGGVVTGAGGDRFIDWNCDGSLSAADAALNRYTDWMEKLALDLLNNFPVDSRAHHVFITQKPLELICSQQLFPGEMCRNHLPARMPTPARPYDHFFLPTVYWEYRMIEALFARDSLDPRIHKLTAEARRMWDRSAQGYAQGIKGDDWTIPAAAGRPGADIAADDTENDADAANAQRVGTVNADHIHHTDSGGWMMADVWYAGLQPYLNSQAPQRTSLFIPPQDTDPQIDANLESHYVALNQSTPLKNQLFLFFPGTGGTPIFQQQLCNTAADLGFHVISLNYPNDEAVNSLCGGVNADLDCYAKVRLEIKDGSDRTPLVNVSRANSIENRLIKLLQYLRARFPDDGWGQYLENDGSIRWKSIVVSGHSQGGGHAGIIGRYHLVARVVMFAAMDYNGRERMPANWIAAPGSTPNATPADRFYGFSHLRDDQVNFTLLSTQVWPAYGMNAFGQIVNVDATTPPYNNTHSLTSNLDSPTGNFHGSVAVDRNLALQADGTPVYKPVWEYLLATPRAAANVSAASYVASPIATESIISAFGSGLATATMAAPTVPLPMILAGTSVRVRDSAGVERSAPIFFVSPAQVNYLIPAGTANGAATVTITSGDGAMSAEDTTIAAVAPGLFTVDASGRGLAAALALRVKPDDSQQFEAVAQFDPAQNKFVAVPIDLGPETDQVFLILFGTGLRYRSALSAAQARIGDVDSQVVFAGAQDGFVGLDQVNISLSRALIGRGEADVSLTADGQATNIVRIHIK